MKRINSGEANTPENSDRIFKTRWEGQEHSEDWNRFVQMAAKFKGGKLLDIGCFNSPMPGYLAEQFPDSEIIGVDHAPYAIEQMQKKFPKVKYICADFLPWVNGVELTPPELQGGTFDYIIAGELIEHLEDPAKFIRFCAWLLKEDGVFAFSTPFEEQISQPAVSHEHIWAFTDADIRELLDPFEEFEVSINRDNVPVFIGLATRKKPV